MTAKRSLVARGVPSLGSRGNDYRQVGGAGPSPLKALPGNKRKRYVSALPTELHQPELMAGLEPATTRLTVEVTVFYATGNSGREQTKAGIYAL